MLSSWFLEADSLACALNLNFSSVESLVYFLQILLLVVRCDLFCFNRILQIEDLPFVRLRFELSSLNLQLQMFIFQSYPFNFFR